jgi:lipopolysaccharide export system protein LptA
VNIHEYQARELFEKYGVATQPGGRVKAILTPKSAPAAPAAGKPAAAPAPSSGSGLRSTTTLGGESKK